MNKKLIKEMLTEIPEATPTLENKYAAPASRTPKPPIDGMDAATQIKGTKTRK